jgi:UDP-glucose 4-epimerase
LRCLVTGGLGFIGSHLVKRLRELGHEVWVLDDCSNPARKPSEEPDLMNADLAHQFPWGYMPDWIFHLAAVSRTAWTIANPMACERVNVWGSLGVLDFARSGTNPSTGKTPRVVLASSNIVYGAPNPYRASKLAMEEYMTAYNELYGLNCIALRYSNVYGPGMRWDDPICLAAMRRSMVENGYIELTGDGNQSRDFTHVHDIVEGTLLAAQSDWRGVFDMTSRYHRSMNAMATLFKCPVRYIAARPGDTKVITQSAQMPLPVKLITPEEGISDVLAEIPQEVRA